MDIKLDPTTHDISASGFDFTTTTDDVDALIQRLKIRLMSFKGDWFLNTDFGVPYFQEIFVSRNPKDDADTIFKLQITSMDGVSSLMSYSSTFNNSTREFNLDFKVKLDNGLVVSTNLLI